MDCYSKPSHISTASTRPPATITESGQDNKALRHLFLCNIAGSFTGWSEVKLFLTEKQELCKHILQYLR